jgi:hypothetical protein
MTPKTRLKYHERSDVVGKPAFNATDTQLDQKLMVVPAFGNRELYGASI